MGGLVVDAIEQILVRLDVEDLIRCKSVCKSWYCSISSPPFVKAHLKYSDNKDRNDPELEHRRISGYSISYDEVWFSSNFLQIVGSCNGLVCISPRDAEFVVTNPCTRVLRNIKTPPFRPHLLDEGGLTIRGLLCWGFGYDSAADDYKVVTGFGKSIDDDKKTTLFYVLTMKSNTWKVIGEVNYMCLDSKTGIFYGGSLYWLMMDENYKSIIVSLDLSTDVLSKIRLPDLLEHEFNACYRLGVIDESLCVYEAASSSYFDIWVIRNNTWELYDNHHWKGRYDVAHFLTLESHVVGSQSYVRWGVDDHGKRVRNAGNYTRASIFVKSLVSPHPYHPDVVNNNKNNNYYYYKEKKRNAKSLSHSLAPSLLIQFQSRFRCTLLEGVPEVKEGVESGAKGNINTKKKGNKKRKRYVLRKIPLVRMSKKTNVRLSHLVESFVS